MIDISKKYSGELILILRTSFYITFVIKDFEISTYYMNGIYFIVISQRYLFLICLVGVLICNGFYYNLQPVK